LLESSCIYIPVAAIKRRRDSSFYIMMGYRLDCWSLIPGKGKVFFSSPQCPDLFWGLPSLLFSRVQGAFSLQIKLPECEVGHSHPSSEEVKNDGAIPPLPHTSSRRGA
jgi:hypothetical protein